MMGYIVYFQVVQSRDIIRSSYNARQDSYADRVVRGDIVDRNGNVLAHSEVQADGSEVREYPYGSLFAHVVGYSDQGKAGLESEMNFELLTSNAFFLEKLRNEFQDQKNTGDTVVTTLDVELQQAAMQRAAEGALYFDHERPDGTMCYTASYKISGENIAIGQSSAKRVMESWMESSGHRANILNSNYVSIGIGCFRQNGGPRCWVQVFGDRKSVV